MTSRSGPPGVRRKKTDFTVSGDCNDCFDGAEQKWDVGRFTAKGRITISKQFRSIAPEKRTGCLRILHPIMEAWKSRSSATVNL
jgi:hypothetical protein